MPDPELVERPRRRRFTAEYKLRILREVDACPLTVAAIHGEVERHLAGTIANGSVKASLARLASAQDPPVLRLSRGLYVRAIDPAVDERSSAAD